MDENYKKIRTFHFFFLSQMYQFNQTLTFDFNLRNFQNTKTNTQLKNGRRKKFSVKIIVNISKACYVIIWNSKQILEFLFSAKA